VKRAAAALLLLGACASPEGTPIVAAEGGTVTSDDGVLTLILPPGALPSDATVTIRPTTDWPVEAPERFDPLAPVYAIEPEVELLEDAYIIVRPPDPAALRGPHGDAFVAHYSFGWSDAKVRPSAHSRTVHLADGRAAVVADVFELGLHWIGDGVPGADRSIPRLAVDVVMVDGPREVGAELRLSRLALWSDLPHSLFSREVFASAAGPVGEPASPLAWDDGVTRTWDATTDEVQLLHAFELFDLGVDAREERMAIHQDLEPVELSAEAPLDPLVEPLPGWRCDGATDPSTRLFVGVDVVTGASAGVARVGAVRELGPAACR